MKLRPHLPRSISLAALLVPEAWTWLLLPTSLSPSSVRSHQIRFLSRLSAAEQDNEGSQTWTNDWQDKDMYQRVFYRWSHGSEVNRHDAVVVEERCRFTVNPDKPGYLLPVGPRTILLRDGRVEDGEIGNEFFTFPYLDGFTHNGAGMDPAVQATIATAMYLASNPELCRGRMLEVACKEGLASLLGCIGAAFALGEFGKANSNDVAEDVFTIKDKSDGMLPKALTTLTLSDSDDKSLHTALHVVKKMGLPASKVNMDVFDWRVRLPRPVGFTRPIPEYRTVVASDVAFSFPEAKELARAVANRLEPSRPYLLNKDPLPTFVHVCPEDRDDVAYLRRLLEKGYRMDVATHYLKLEKLSFHFQKLPSGEPESKLDDEELELKEFKEIKYQSLTAQHHPEYAGEGSGELFFPLETGEYELTGGSSFLEKEGGMNPW